MCDCVHTVCLFKVLSLPISRVQVPVASLCSPCVTKCDEYVGGLKSEKLELKSKAATDLENLTL